MASHGVGPRPGATQSGGLRRLAGPRRCTWRAEAVKQRPWLALQVALLVLAPLPAAGGVAPAAVADAPPISMGHPSGQGDRWPGGRDGDVERGAAPAALRRLQSSAAGQTAEDVAPTLDEVDSVFFSRPPYSAQVQNMTVWYTFAGIYVACALVVVVGVNLDAAERRKRLARAIVPQEYVTHKVLCCKMTVPLENIPCEITEQYYLDQRLVALRNDNEIASRKQLIGFRGYFSRNAQGFMEVLLRDHLILSFLLKAIPTFTRVKRAALVVMQLHLCMLLGALVLNVHVHNAPQASYVLFSCGGKSSDECFATVPAAILAAFVSCPVFRFIAVRQMRLTCFVSQSHPSTSRFPLGMRKFASLAPKSFAESALCMRNGYERHKARVAQQRPFTHRVVHALWQTTQSSIKDLRFYGPATSWCICLLMSAFVACSAAYVLSYTVYMKDAVVYHWLVWILVMFSFWTLFLEPLLVFWTQVLWCSLVATVAQKWGYGSHALAATTVKYTKIISEVDDAIVTGLRRVASVRIQRWWSEMRSQNKQAKDQTDAAISNQKRRRKNAHKRNILKERKWCMRVDVIDCGSLPEPAGLDAWSPFVRLTCDVGNDKVSDTKAIDRAGKSAVFNETIFVDIKESTALNVEVWSTTSTGESIVARGGFELDELRAKEEKEDRPEGHTVSVDLSDATGSATSSGRAFVNLRATFLDPTKDECGYGQDDWMLPKHRMAITFSKMPPGAKMGHLLGARTPRSSVGPGTPAEPAEENDCASVASNRIRQPPEAQRSCAEYVADKSQLSTEAPGLEFRSGKDLEALAAPVAHVPWGSTVEGVDEGDGWLLVERAGEVLYLPMALQETPVLRRSDGGARAPTPGSAALGPTGSTGSRTAPRAPKAKAKPTPKAKMRPMSVQDAGLGGAFGGEAAGRSRLGRPPPAPGRPMGTASMAGSLAGSRRPSVGSAAGTGVGTVDVVNGALGVPRITPAPSLPAASDAASMANPIGFVPEDPDEL